MTDKPEASGKDKGGFQIPGTKIKVPPKILLFGGIALVAILVLTRGGGGGGGGGGEAQLPTGDPRDNDNDGNEGDLDALRQFSEQQRESNKSLLEALLGGCQGLIPPAPVGDGGGGGGWGGPPPDVGIMPPAVAGGFPVDSFYGGDSVGLVDAPITNELSGKPSGEKGSLTGTPTPTKPQRGVTNAPKRVSYIDPKSKTVQERVTKGTGEVVQGKGTGLKEKPTVKPTVTPPKVTTVKTVDPKSKTIVETRTVTKGTESGKKAGKGTGVKPPTVSTPKPVIKPPTSGGKVKGK